MNCDNDWPATRSTSLEKRSSLIKSSNILLDERIFSHTFIQKPRMDKLVSWTLKEVRLAAAATVYNIALSHHLLGLQDANNRKDSDNFLKAYQAAGSLLSSAMDDVILEDNDVKLLALAIANNEGHIHEQVFASDKAMSCLRQVQSIVRFTVWSDEVAQFHTTALLFSHPDGIILHSPIA